MRIILFVTAVTFVGCAHLQQTDLSAAESIASSDMPLVYRCKSGRKVNASYGSGTTAVVKYEGGRHKMTVAVSGSGARYIGGGLAWWTKGREQGSEGISPAMREIIEMCSQASSG
ncbi:MAG: MliC family protein [Nitrosospira sp.]